MNAPKEILDLVARFEQQLDACKSGQYNETQLRQEFLNPFFKALGWDVDNTAGFAQAYKDVIHEDAIRISGAVKAPDYCFRIGGTRKFSSKPRSLPWTSSRRLARLTNSAATPGPPNCR